MRHPLAFLARCPCALAEWGVGARLLRAALVPHLSRASDWRSCDATGAGSASPARAGALQRAAQKPLALLGRVEHGADSIDSAVVALRELGLERFERVQRLLG